MAEARTELFKFLKERRSASILSEPKPSRAEVEKILNLAGTVPDHGLLRPYRFLVVSDSARDRFGDALVLTAEEKRAAKLDEAAKPKIKAKAFAAPLQVLIIYSPVASEKIHAWEQMATAACTGYALVLGANALGYGAVWKSFAYDPGMSLKELLNLKDNEKFLGWVNIGSERDRSPAPREPLDLSRHADFLS